MVSIEKDGDRWRATWSQIPQFYWSVSVSDPDRKEALRELYRIAKLMGRSEAVLKEIEEAGNAGA